MSEDFVVTDAPVDTGSGATAEIADTGPETALETPETGGEPESQPAGERKPGEPPASTGGRPIVDGHLSPEFKPIYEKLKAESPGTARAILSALQFEERIRKEVPGGIKEIRELRQNIETLGGQDGIQELTGELDGWRGFDEKYTAGDPEVLKFLTETPEASAAFLKIAPAAFEKFRELNPDGFGAYVSQVFEADLIEQRIPLILDRLADFLPADKPQAKELLDRLTAYVNRIGTMARKSVAPAVPKASEQDSTRLREIESRETNLRRTEWRGETDRIQRSIFQPEWKKIVGDRKISPSQMSAFSKLYKATMEELLGANAQFKNGMDRHFAANSKDGFIRAAEAGYRSAIPRAIRAALQEAGVNLTAKPAASAGAKGAPPAGSQQTPAAGFTLVNAKPNFADVNNRLTTPDMWLKRQAVLKDGRKVTWKA